MVPAIVPQKRQNLDYIETLAVIPFRLFSLSLCLYAFIKALEQEPIKPASIFMYAYILLMFMLRL